MNDVDHPEELPAVLSICTGIRGIERGLNRAIGRTRTLAQVEIEAFAIENLLAGMEAGILDAAPIWSNLKTFPSYPFRNEVDILLGGYPCQPFSTAGNRGGDTDPRHLWPQIENIIGTVNPLCCFFENVAGHLTLGFDQVYRSLSDLGYAVEAGIFTAEEVGAPHKRERLFILAILADAEGAGIRRRLGHLCKANGRSDGGLQFVPNSAGEELANPECTERRPSHIGGHEYYSGTIFVQREGSKNADRLEQCRKGLADSFCTGLEGIEIQPARQEQPAAERSSGFDRWPAGPREPQHAWESPRVISRKVEPDMGLSAHGYGFREDLLRALGNSVVEQTAELAFRTLLEKHLS